MIPIRDLFETHLTVANLQRSMNFFGEVLGLELASVLPERKVAFYWIGGRGHSMLGLWEAGSGPQRLSLHFAFNSDLLDVLDAPARLRSAGVEPLDSWGKRHRRTGRHRMDARRVTVLPRPGRQYARAALHAAGNSAAGNGNCQLEPLAEPQRIE